jgi:hypothetical protein
MSGLDNKARDIFLGYNDAYTSTENSRMAYQLMFNLSWEPTRYLGLASKNVVLLDVGSSGPTADKICRKVVDAINKAAVSSLVANGKRLENERLQRIHDAMRNIGKRNN